MNKERRNKISKILNEIEKIKSELESVLFDEQMVFDNMPENLQGSMRGEESEEAIDCMSEAVDSLQEALGQLTDII